MKLPSLRKWRKHRGLTQVELAAAAGIPQGTLTRIETGMRGCALPAAQRLAAALGVDLVELQKESQEEASEATKEARSRRFPRGSTQALHRAYLERLLVREVGSSYMALPDEEIERRCKKLSWEEVIEVVTSREREAKVLESELEEEGLHREVRSFFEEVLQGFPDQDICLLAAARRREKTERGREELTRAMRELL